LAEFWELLIRPLIERNSTGRSNFDGMLLNVCIVVSHAKCFAGSSKARPFVVRVDWSVSLRCRTVVDVVFHLCAKVSIMVQITSGGPALPWYPQGVQRILQVRGKQRL
jgi:hypothetical protein